jgi:hypothetical protein
MTVLTTLTYMVCALIERYALNDMVRKGPWKEYAVLAVVTFLVSNVPPGLTSGLVVWVMGGGRAAP